MGLAPREEASVAAQSISPSVLSYENTLDRFSSVKSTMYGGRSGEAVIRNAECVTMAPVRVMQVKEVTMPSRQQSRASLGGSSGGGVGGQPGRRFSYTVAEAAVRESTIGCAL
jgi:hypothetical protein